MKKLFTFASLLITCLLFLVPSISAHAIGQPPYLKVNGVFTDYYPVPTTSLPEFELPQDIAVGTFIVNEPVEFEIDVNALPVPAEVVEKTKFIWEFGDESTGDGLKNSHTYSKPGTYFMNIKADSGEGFEPQLLQSTAINILPDRNYKLPKAVIEVNGKQVKDPLLDIIEVNFSSKQKLNGNDSDSGSSEITEYFWDLGNQQSAEGKEITYAYSENPYTVFPVLRIKTKDGFITDSFVQIKDENAFSEKTGFLNSDSGLNWKIIIAAIIVSLILAAGLTWLISKFLFKKNKSAS